MGGGGVEVGGGGMTKSCTDFAEAFISLINYIIIDND